MSRPSRLRLLHSTSRSKSNRNHELDTQVSFHTEMDALPEHFNDLKSKINILMH
jgi:hypothetical protein